MPGGEPDPMVTAQFLSDVRACQWNGGHLVGGKGIVYFPHVNRGRNTWERATEGLTLSQETYNLLCGGTANGDGSFTAASGARYTLHATSTIAVHVAV